MNPTTPPNHRSHLCAHACTGVEVAVHGMRVQGNAALSGAGADIYVNRDDSSSGKFTLVIPASTFEGEQLPAGLLAGRGDRSAGPVVVTLQ